MNYEPLTIALLTLLALSVLLVEYFTGWVGSVLRAIWRPIAGLPRPSLPRVPRPRFAWPRLHFGLPSVSSWTLGLPRLRLWPATGRGGAGEWRVITNERRPVPGGASLRVTAAPVTERPTLVIAEREDDQAVEEPSARDRTAQTIEGLVHHMRQLESCLSETRHEGALSAVRHLKRLLESYEQDDLMLVGDDDLSGEIAVYYGDVTTMVVELDDWVKREQQAEVISWPRPEGDEAVDPAVPIQARIARGGRLLRSLRAVESALTR